MSEHTQAEKTRRKAYQLYFDCIVGDAGPPPKSPKYNPSEIVIQMRALWYSK